MTFFRSPPSYRRARSKMTAREVLEHAESEDQFQSWLTDLLTVLGYRWYHTHDARRSPEGFPDLVAVRGLRLLFIETKSMQGHLSRDQEAWLGDLHGTGKAEVYQWRPSDRDLIEAVLR